MNDLYITKRETKGAFSPARGKTRIEISPAFLHQKIKDDENAIHIYKI